jgi:hypothetical protein
MVAVMALVMAVMACGVEFAGDGTSPSQGVSSPPPTMRIDNMALPTVITSVVTAPEGTRVRSRPDAAGPTLSIELAVMRPGDEFQAQECELVAGQWWAFGIYDTYIHGWTLAQYLSPNPCVK